MTSARVNKQRRLSLFTSLLADPLWGLCDQQTPQDVCGEATCSQTLYFHLRDRRACLDRLGDWIDQHFRHFKRACIYYKRLLPVNKIYLFSFQQKNVRNTTAVKIHLTQKPSRVVTLGNTGDFHLAKDSSSNFISTKLLSSNSLDFNLFDKKGRKDFFHMELQRLEKIITILYNYNNYDGYE